MKIYDQVSSATIDYGVIPPLCRTSWPPPRGSSTWGPSPGASGNGLLLVLVYWCFGGLIARLLFWCTDLLLLLY